MQGEPYIIVDAGGGTVDLVAQMLTVEDTTGAVGLKELVAGSGDTCGGVYVDQAFKAFLADYVGAKAINDLQTDKPDEYIKLMRAWEEIKRTFAGNEEAALDLDLPKSMRAWTLSR